MTILMVLLGPALAILTYLVLGPLDQGVHSNLLRLVLLADFVYVMIVATMVMSGVVRMIGARRARSAGSRLHLRLTAAFGLLALLPTILVAVFAVLTVNVGLEGWFSERVRSVLGNSLAAAEAYEQEHRDGLIQDTEAIAAYLDLAKQANVFLADAQLRQSLAAAQKRIQRGLREAYVISADGSIRVRGESSYLFEFEQPPQEAVDRAMAGETVVIEDWEINEFRAIVQLSSYPDHFLYVTRDVDGEVLNLLDETQETVLFYQQLESQRGQVLFEFALIYLGFAVILVLAATWMGMWYAERLARPVGRLAAASELVGAGDLNVQVPEESTGDEIEQLGKAFNQMTRQLKGQRVRLLESTEQIERRRRLFDSVLSSVTAGVIGLDAEGRVTFLNRAAHMMLGLDGDEPDHAPLAEVVPEFTPLLERLQTERVGRIQEELSLSRMGRQERLLVRLAPRFSDGGTLEGYVIAFDDVTDLVTRIVDEFSKFARMPRPERRQTDLAELVRGAVMLQKAGQEGVTFEVDVPGGAVPAELDDTMIGQALTNIIKNAGEAIESLQEAGETPEGHVPTIRIDMHCDPDGGVAEIRICDNGIGLPEDRARLFEPYVTTREKGTGLGLPIVKKIIEEHGGTLALVDAPLFGGTDRPGACALMRLPITCNAAPAECPDRKE